MTIHFQSLIYTNTAHSCEYILDNIIQLWFNLQLSPIYDFELSKFLFPVAFPNIMDDALNIHGKQTPFPHPARVDASKLHHRTELGIKGKKRPITEKQILGKSPIWSNLYTKPIQKTPSESSLFWLEPAWQSSFRTIWSCICTNHSASLSTACKYPFHFIRNSTYPFIIFHSL